MNPGLILRLPAAGGAIARETRIGSLDAATGYAIIDLMFEMNRRNGATLVLVTHDAELAERCDATVTIEAGRLVNGIGV